MESPAAIGRVHYNQPRAVKVREPENLDSIHSAVYGPINVFVNSQVEATKLMAAWPSIMQAVADKVQEVLG